MSGSCLSLASLSGSLLRRSVKAAGLSSQIVNLDGETTMNIWAPMAPTSKPNLILIHGFGPQSIWQFRKQIPFLAREFNLYLPDLVFFGESTTNSSDKTEIFQATSVAKLLEKMGVSRYSVVGTSYGGFVAYRLATMWAERVEKVVIASSAMNMRASDYKTLLKTAKVESIEDLLMPTTGKQLRALLAYIVYRPPSYVPEFLLNDFIQKLFSENRQEKVELLMALTAQLDETIDVYPLPQEVLLIWGEHDHIFPLEKTQELLQLLGNHVRLEVIPKASHVPQLERPAQFNVILKSFLDDH